MSQPVSKTGTPVERILSVASDLFYKQGYRATGINEVIAKSGVAKATFYNHFASKDDLCKAYLVGVADLELKTLDDMLKTLKDPVSRFTSIIESLHPWLLDTDFRGCNFLHMVAEVPDAQSPLRKEGKRLYDGVRERATVLTHELIESDSKKYGHLVAEDLINEYMLIFSGAIALAEIYHAEWPVEHSVKMLHSLIKA
jgi:AcrR family transcriptional regulator